MLVGKVQASGCAIVISSWFGDVAGTVTGVCYHCVIVNGCCVIVISYYKSILNQSLLSSNDQQHCLGPFIYLGDGCQVAAVVVGSGGKLSLM